MKASATVKLGDVSGGAAVAWAAVGFDALAAESSDASDGKFEEAGAGFEHKEAKRALHDSSVQCG